ncbi:MAG: hypothetical protein QW348_00330 [Ignisphaera sp.]
MSEHICEEFFAAINRVVPGYGNFLRLYIFSSRGSSAVCKDLCHILEAVKVLSSAETVNCIVKAVCVYDNSLCREFRKCLDDLSP